MIRGREIQLFKTESGRFSADPVPGFLHLWMRSFGVAFLTSMAVVPLVRRVVGALVDLERR